jgi:hypothetical protein
VASKMMSSAVIAIQKYGADAERVSIRATQVTRCLPKMNMSVSRIVKNSPSLN